MELRNVIVFGIIAVGLVGLTGCDYERMETLGTKIQEARQPGTETVANQTSNDQTDDAVSDTATNAEGVPNPGSGHVIIDGAKEEADPGKETAGDPGKDALPVIADPKDPSTASPAVPPPLTLVDPTDATKKTGLTEGDDKKYFISGTATEIAAPYSPPPPSYSISGTATEFAAPLPPPPPPTYTITPKGTVASMDEK